MKYLFIFLLTITLIGCSTTKKVNSENKENIKEEDKIPPLTNAVVKKIWVKSKIQGNEFHDGHWMYLIEKPVRWNE